MTYTIVVLPRADQDVRRIFEWLSERSPGSAERWHAAYSAAIASLGENPERVSMASESPMRGLDIRELLFSTPKGRKYRILFTISLAEVRILHVRGPRQAPVDIGEG